MEFQIRIILMNFMKIYRINMGFGTGTEKQGTTV